MSAETTLMEDLEESLARDVIANELYRLVERVGDRIGLARTEWQRYLDAAALALRWLDADWRELAVYGGALALHAESFRSPDLRESGRREQGRRIYEASAAQRGALDVLTGRAPERIEQARQLRAQMKAPEQDEHNPSDTGAFSDVQEAIVLQMRDPRRS